MLKNRNLSLLYMGWTFRSIAFSLTTIYGPIFFYKFGYSPNDVFLLLAVGAFGNAASRVVIFKILLRQNASNILPFLVIIQAIISVLIGLYYENYTLLMYLVLLEGLISGASWSCYLMTFTDIMKLKNLGTQVSMQFNLTHVFSAIALAFGAVIGVRYGVAVNYFIASAVLLLAAITFYKMKLQKFKTKNKSLSIKEYWGLRYDVASSLGDMPDLLITRELWPFIAVVFFGVTVEFTGFILGLSILGIALFTFLVGRISDSKKNSLELLNKSIYLGQAVHLFRLAAIISGLFASLITLIGPITRTLYDVPYNVFFYRRSRLVGEIKYITYYEITGNIIYGFFWLILAYLTIELGLKTTVIIATLMGFICLPMLRLINKRTGLS